MCYRSQRKLAARAVVSKEKDGIAALIRNLRRDMTGPQGEVVGFIGGQLIVQGCNVVDQPEVLKREHVRHGRWEDAERWEGEHASPLPLGNSSLDLGSPHEIGLVRSG